MTPTRREPDNTFPFLVLNVRHCSTLVFTYCRIEGDDAQSEGAGRLSAYVSFGGLLMRLQVRTHWYCIVQILHRYHLGHMA